MENSNDSATPESEKRPDSVGTNGSNEGTHSSKEHAETSDSGLNLTESGSKMNESIVDEEVAPTSGLDTPQDSIPETVSSDLRDKNDIGEGESSETPATSTSGNTSCAEVIDTQNTLVRQSQDEDNINKSQADQETESEPNSTGVLDLTSHTNNINVTDSGSSKLENYEPPSDNEPSNIDSYSNQNKAEVEQIDSPIMNDGCSQKEIGDNNNSLYYIKWIMWKGLKTAVVTQNDNGPCPLLAIINILLLRRVIAFPSMQEIVTTQQLMEYLGDVVLKGIPENMPEGTQRNFEQNMQDALSILPKLQTGLDVNVKFTGVGDFEFTSECVIFDLLSIRLYHGWLIDPQSMDYKMAIGNLSYNQLVEKIIASQEANGDSQVSAEGLSAQSFLNETANQLTHHGVCELNAKLKEEELCVFFRNNHFSTLYKYQGELFILLTDQGFLTQDKIVWQTLSSVDGDGAFVDCSFKSIPMRSEPLSDIPHPNSNSALSQEDQDYMLALSIQSDQQQQVQQQPQQQTEHQMPNPASIATQQPLQESQSNEVMTEQELYDFQYAIQLQEEEEARARTSQRQHHRQQAAQRRAGRRQSPLPPSEIHHERHVQQRSSGSGCVIL